jgi:hypothetical protein
MGKNESSTVEFGIKRDSNGGHEREELWQGEVLLEILIPQE